MNKAVRLPLKLTAFALSLAALLACAVLVFVFTASAQTIPKGANGIELTTNLVDSTLFESVQTYLENEDFTIEKADEELDHLSAAD